ncbi:hypothetical protein BDM02DRAFT_314332 [Thelephora ganbajun]|uniref:Uncharacterized protein n=1 Tax=Thelephora ganbajun TaxID=370292 RepID=A0ACB6Z990_THEGA|nr:hypothetical protein BDM02DRAFT_314332 [Thelephora ganbajun]
MEKGHYQIEARCSRFILINSIERNDVLVGEPLLCTVLAHDGRRCTNVPSCGNSTGLFGFRKEPSERAQRRGTPYLFNACQPVNPPVTWAGVAPRRVKNNN